MKREDGPVDDRLRWTALTEARMIAEIWATVDTDRIVAGLGLPSELLAGDPHLGARVTVVRPGDGDPLAIVEPATEGRLAETLARRGEGRIGDYVESPLPLDRLAALAASAGVRLSRPLDGPFGRSVLVHPGTPGDPLFLVVERPAGTIGR
jgi:hypothetical protein